MRLSSINAFFSRHMLLRYGPDNTWFLDAFAKFRKGTFTLALSVRPSVHQYGATRLPLDGFSLKKTDISVFFRKSVGKFQIFLKSNNNKGTLHKDLFYIYDNVSLISSYNEKFFRQNLYRKSNAHFLFGFLSFRKSYRLWDNVEKIVHKDRPRLTI